MSQINGIIAQFHVIISVVVVLKNRKIGFIASTVLNLINPVMAVMAVTVGGQKSTAVNHNFNMYYHNYDYHLQLHNQKRQDVRITYGKH